MNTIQALELINADHPENCRMARVLLESWIRSGKCPFGIYVRQEGKERGTYAIFPERLRVYLSGTDMKDGGRMMTQNKLSAVLEEGGNAVTMQEIEKLLHKQAELLAEKSRKSDLTVEELCALSDSLCQIIKVTCQL